MQCTKVKMTEIDKTIPLRQIDELARELYSKEYDLASWWFESIKLREEWRDKAQAILEAKRG